MSHFTTYLALTAPASVMESRAIDTLNNLAGEAPYRAESRGLSDGDGKSYILKVNGFGVAVTFVDSQLPSEAWESAAERNESWPEASDVMRFTRAHVVVSLVADTYDHATAVAGASIVTLAAGALAKHLPMAATVFRESNEIDEGDGIWHMAMALVAGRFPDMLWMTQSHFAGEPLPDGTPTNGASTHGLRAFIGHELQLQPAPLPPGEIAKRLVGLFQYVMANGPVIKDGHQVGMPGLERTIAQFLPEGREASGPVIQLTMDVSPTGPPEAAKPEPVAAPPQSEAAQRPVFGKRVS
jgi:Domain of unknown function (DUF4261)